MIHDTFDTALYFIYNGEEIGLEANNRAACTGVGGHNAASDLYIANQGEGKQHRKLDAPPD